MANHDGAGRVIRVLLDNPDQFLTKDTKGLTRFADLITLALNEAEALGMEKAAQIAWNHRNKVGMDIAKSIRAQAGNTGGAVGQSAAANSVEKESK
jgi:hypothetical protein